MFTGLTMRKGSSVCYQGILLTTFGFGFFSTSESTPTIACRILPPPAQTNYAWEKPEEKSLSFYISIFAREPSRQAVWNVNVCLSSYCLI